MLFKSFKKKVFIDSEFLITVYHKKSDFFDSYFKVSYITPTNNNIDKVIALYDKKAELITMCYNNAEKLNHITVSIND